MKGTFTKVLRNITRNTSELLFLRWQVSFVKADGKYLPLCPKSVPGAGTWQQQRSRQDLCEVLRNCSGSFAVTAPWGCVETSGVLKGRILLLQMEGEREEQMSCAQPVQLLPGRKIKG